jgi:catalase (peroxidase I)
MDTSSRHECSPLIAPIGSGLISSSIQDSNEKSITDLSNYESFHDNSNHSNNTSSHSTYRQFYSTFVFVAVAVLAIGVVTYHNSVTTTFNKNDDRIPNHQKQNHHNIIEQLGASNNMKTNDDSVPDESEIALQATHGLQLQGYSSPSVQMQYEKDLAKVNWDDVKADLATLLKDSKDWWPADYGSYGPLMIRLSWHTCGSYRTSDGRGGCDGGSQRYDPERSWPDNTNLDKARKLLQPIKLKYGNGVSWGDLFALVGTVAIHEMGGPHIGFCAGRQDVQDNTQTLSLGPSLEQEQFSQCPVNGQCPYPLGANTLGLVCCCRNIPFSFSILFLCSN